MYGVERIQRNLLILRGLCGAALGFARFAPWEDSPPGQSAPLVLDNEGLWSCELSIMGEGSKKSLWALGSV